MRRMRRQRGGLPGDGTRFGRPCDSATDWFCTKKVATQPYQPQGQSPGVVQDFQKGAQGLATGVGNAFTNFGQDIGLGSKTPQSYAAINAADGNPFSRQSQPQPYGNQLGGRRRRSTRRRKQSRRRTASRRR